MRLVTAHSHTSQSKLIKRPTARSPLARLHGGMHLLLQHGTEDIATDPEGTKRLYEQAAAAGGDALMQEGVATVRRSLPRHWPRPLHR